MEVLAAARANGAAVAGPNTAGLVTPGECFVGFMPAFEPDLFRPGRVGVVSRSGSLGTLICLNLVQAGFGESAFIGIGGDPIIGTTTARRSRPSTPTIVRTRWWWVGEIGGAMGGGGGRVHPGHAQARRCVHRGRGLAPGKKMGHAGAIVMGDKGSWASKRRALEAAGSRCSIPVRRRAGAPGGAWRARGRRPLRQPPLRVGDRRSAPGRAARAAEPGRFAREHAKRLPAAARPPFIFAMRTSSSWS